MKQSTIKLIEDKFKNDVYKINSEIRKNKYDINQLAIKQRQLKDIRKGLFEILGLVR